MLYVNIEFWSARDCIPAFSKNIRGCFFAIRCLPSALPSVSTRSALSLPMVLGLVEGREIGVSAVVNDLRRAVLIDDFALAEPTLELPRFKNAVKAEGG